MLRAKDLLAAGHQVMRDDPAQAITAFEKARELFEQTGDVSETVIAENWAAQFLPDIGKVAEGRARLTAILANAENRKFKILIPSIYYWRGLSDFSQSRYSESTRNYKTALRFAESTDNVFEVQHAAEALAYNYSSLGESEQALSYASKMISAKSLYYEGSNQLIRDLGTLADLSLKLQFFSASSDFGKEGLSIARGLSPVDVGVTANLRRLEAVAETSGDFPTALDYANQSKQLALSLKNTDVNTRVKAGAYLVLAGIKSKSNKCEEALTDYEKALELYLDHPEVTNSLYQLHKGKLFCYQQLNRQEDFATELKTVLALSEEYRTTIREDDSRQAFFANEQDVFDAAAANAIQQHDSRRAFAFVEASRARSLLDFVESDKPIIEVEKSFGAVSQPLPLEELQRRLPDQVQVVQYAVLPDKLAIWVLSKSRFDLIEKPITAGELQKKIDDYQTAIVGKESAGRIEQAAKDLYQLLIPTDLDGNKQLCLVPDKSLHQLAFASLISAGGKYLLEEFALVQAPSASVFVLASENAARKERVVDERVLSVGNPDFDREENQGLADLYGAEAEAKTVAADYKNSRKLLTSEATKDEFVRHFTQVEVVHFAGHFVANRQSPRNSKLLFAGGEMRASELSSYKLPLAKLVVLSACETGFERYDKSEGAIGIARTFLALGSPIVIASQWKVDSEPTKDLMVAFHRNRKERGMTTAESLRQAQLEISRRDDTKAPFYWAAFSLFGGYANY
ncbi:MAG TPA: CHAT domain-containing protein [Pyrinomonadaceae bacterium]|nr:CHAT domain-containing protein [Pyrinomonadaceae bacterium]